MRSLRARLAEHGLVLIAFLAVSVLATWPLAAHFSDGVLGPPGDNYEYLYKIASFRSAMDEVRSPLYLPDVFYPVGYDVSLSETTLANMLMALPFAVLWGEVAAYNAVVLLTFALSGWAAYWLVRDLTGSRAGALVAGVIFAFNPYRMSHLAAGHLPLLGTQWIPLAFLFAERGLRSMRLRDAALAGLFFGLTALSSWYYAYMVGLFLFLFVIVRLIQRRRELAVRPLAAASFGFVAVAALVMLPAAVPLLQNAGAGATEYRDLAYVDQWSASLLDFVWPSVFNPVWGRALASAHIPNVLDGMTYLGWPALALAGVGIWKWKDKSRTAYVWLGAVALVLALGTTLHLAGGPLRIGVPDGIERAFARAMNFLTTRAALNPLPFASMRVPGTIALPMPALLLYLFLPFFSAMRVPARFELGALLAVAVLAGAGTAYLVRQTRSRAATLGIGAALVAVLALDLASAPFPLGYSEARAQPVDDWLASQPNPSPLVQLPLDRTWYGYPLYQQRFHNQPIAYGYGTFVPPAFQPVETTLERFPDAEALDWMEQSGVKIALLAQNGFGASWSEVERTMAARSDWQFVGKFEDRPLFHDGGLMAMVPPTPVVPPSEWVAGNKKATIQDTIWVYRFVGSEVQ